MVLKPTYCSKSLIPYVIFVFYIFWMYKTQLVKFDCYCFCIVCKLLSIKINKYNLLTWNFNLRSITLESQMCDTKYFWNWNWIIKQFPKQIQFKFRGIPIDPSVVFCSPLLFPLLVMHVIECFWGCCHSWK